MKLLIAFHALAIISISSIPQSVAQNFGIVFNRHPFEATDYYHCSSVVTQITKPDPNNPGQSLPVDFSDTTELTDAILAGIATYAAEEMVDLMGNALPTIPAVHIPSTMSALVAGNELYLSSSIKRNHAGFAAVYTSSEASKALTRCAIAWAGEGVGRVAKPHRTDGNCAEVGAAHMYFKRHIGSTPPLPTGSRIATVIWTVDENHENGGEYSVIAPCGWTADTRLIKPEWGCYRFVQGVGARGIYRKEIADFPAGWGISFEQVCL